MTNSSLSLAAATVAIALSSSASFAGGYALPLIPNLQFPAETQSVTQSATPQSYICTESGSADKTSPDVCSTSAKAK